MWAMESLCVCVCVCVLCLYVEACAKYIVCLCVNQKWKSAEKRRCVSDLDNEG